MGMYDSEDEDAVVGWIVLSVAACLTIAIFIAMFVSFGVNGLYFCGGGTIVAVLIWRYWDAICQYFKKVEAPEDANEKELNAHESGDGGSGRGGGGRRTLTGRARKKRARRARRRKIEKANKKRRETMLAQEKLRKMRAELGNARLAG